MTATPRSPAPAARTAPIPAPALFVAHGSPMFALEPDRLGPRLGRLGARLAPLSAVLVVSAHWQSPDVRVMTTARPVTLHDFGGFPEDLYRLRYEPKGAPVIAAAAGHLLVEAGFHISHDNRRGLDHGAWVPLRYLLPGAEVPTFQVSLPVGLDAAGAFRLGTALAPLRDYGVLIVGSGSLTHNLAEIAFGTPDPGYAEDFADWVHDCIMAGDAAPLVDYRACAPHAARAHPTEEHFLPLLVARGAARQDTPQTLSGGMVAGVQSMDSFVWEAPGTGRGAGREVDWP